MISDGIENCLQYVHNFNPENQIIRLHISHRLSIMRFLDEYRRKRNKPYVKNKMIENMTIDENLI